MFREQIMYFIQELYYFVYQVNYKIYTIQKFNTIVNDIWLYGYKYIYIIINAFYVQFQLRKS